MISYPEEYGKVYSYSYRRKIHENPQYPPNINLNTMFDIKNKTNLHNYPSKTTYHFEENQNIRPRTSISSYLRHRYQNSEKTKTNSKDFDLKSNKFAFEIFIKIFCHSKDGFL